MDTGDKQKYMVVTMSFLLLAFIFISTVAKATTAAKKSPSPSPQVSPSPSPEISPSPSGTPSPTPKPSASPKVSPSPSPSASPKVSPSPSASPILKADLIISDYSFTPSPIKTGSEFTVNIGISNQGNTPAGGFGWTWWSDGSIICQNRIDGLAVKEKKFVTCSSTYYDTNEHKTKVVVDTDNEVDEIDKGNNTKEETVKGS